MNLSAAPLRIAVVTDDPGWHGRQLLKSMLAYGVDARYLRLQDCRIDLDHSEGLYLGEFRTELPDGVFVRGVPGGSLEQVILRLDILHALRESGVPVYNDAKAIERTVDKGMTSLLLHRAGLPTPPTWVCETQEEIKAILQREWASGHTMVCKPLFGSQGEGIIKLNPHDALPDLDVFKGVAYLQRFIPSWNGISCDFRVFVIGGKVDCAMARYGKDWINNVAQGARCEALTPSGDLELLAERAVEVLEMDYAGVDLIRGQDGHLQILEVNSVPAWYGLQSVTPHRIADRLIADFLNRRVMPAATLRHPLASQLYPSAHRSSEETLH